MKVSQVAKIIGAYYMQLRICEALSMHDKTKAISLTSKKMIDQEEAIKAVVNKINQDCMVYKMMPEYGKQKPEVPLTRRERRALKRKKK